SRTVRIALVSDHNGHRLRRELAAWIRADGHVVEDRGPEGADVVDYPPLCVEVCDLVVSGSVDRAIVVGGSGMGETIACNKIPGIRAGLCIDVFHARISRANNDANVLVLGAKVVTSYQARAITRTWLTTDFTGGVHARRLAQISDLEHRRGRS
ncbi:MAG: ribose-5-phosphate isomerase, partial [Klenkia sp.]|nr:ribose-5-phosphate isomerase [Klenkia sp.]